MKLPSASNLQNLTRMAANRRWSNAQEELFDEVFGAWSAEFGLEAPRKTKFTEAQQVFADALRVVDAGQDGNLIEGILIKRPRLLAPGVAAIGRLGLAKLGAILAKLEPLLAPRPHAESRAARSAWIESRAGSTAADKANRLFMPFLNQTDGACRALFAWALAHPAEFFADRPGRSRKRVVHARTKLKLLPASMRGALAAATKNGRVMPRGGDADMTVTDALVELEAAMGEDDPGGRVPPVRQQARALLTIANGYATDGLYVGMVMNHAEDLGGARAAAKRLRLKTVSRHLDGVARLVKLDPDDLENRLKKVERAIERSRFSPEAYHGVIRTVLEHPECFFER